MMHEQCSVAESSAHSVIVPNAAVFCPQGSQIQDYILTSPSLSRCSKASPSGRYSASISDVSRWNNSNSNHLMPHHHGHQLHTLQTRRKSDSDVLHRSPPATTDHLLSQPVSPSSRMSINRVADVRIHDDMQNEMQSDAGSGIPNSHHQYGSNSINSISPQGSSSIASGVTMSEMSPMADISLESDTLSNNGNFPSEAMIHDIKEECFSPVRGRPRTAIAPAQSPCMICGDRSTGKHYGAFSCDGCKGFFRRSIRKNNSYTCRFSRDCKVTRDRRNQCRFCRLRKCMNAGMRKDAVQNERDHIRQRRSGTDVPTPTPNEGDLTMAILMDAEKLCKRDQPSNTAEPRLDSERRIASVTDVAQSVKQQLLALVDWAKAIPPFAALSIDDKIKLLKAHSGEHLLLGIALRSFNADGYLLLGNDKLIPRQHQCQKEDGCHTLPNELSGSNIDWIASMVLDDVVKPLRKWHVDEKEFMLLKAIIFFYPQHRGLEDSAAIESIRLQAQLLLEDYIAERTDVDPRGRFGQMMLVLPDLQDISKAMIKQIQFTKNYGFTEIDILISEMLLGSMKGDDEPSDDRGPMIDQTSGERFIGPLTPSSCHFPSTETTSPVVSSSTGMLIEPCDLSYQQQQQQQQTTHVITKQYQSTAVQVTPEEIEQAQNMDHQSGAEESLYDSSIDVVGFSEAIGHPGAVNGCTGVDSGDCVVGVSGHYSVGGLSDNCNASNLGNCNTVNRSNSLMYPNSPENIGHSIARDHQHCGSMFQEPRDLTSYSNYHYASPAVTAAVQLQPLDLHQVPD